MAHIRDEFCFRRIRALRLFFSDKEGILRLLLLCNLRTGTAIADELATFVEIGDISDRKSDCLTGPFRSRVHEVPERPMRREIFEMGFLYSGVECLRDAGLLPCLAE